MKPVLQVKNLRKAFKGVETVHLKSLTVYEGEIYGFLGPNGAGKSTTMKMILSLLSPTAGEIWVNGQAIGKDTCYLQDIGSMIEEPSYYPNLTGYENLLVFQKMLGFDKANIQPTLELVGLAEAKNHKKLVKDYSLGMKQRLALAFALVKKPKILLLDEPTNGLDPAGIHEIRELIIRLAKEQGLTIFISSHILPEIEHVADRVGIIHHGQLVYEGRIEDIQANSWLEVRGKFDQEMLQQLPVRVLECSSDKLILPDMPDAQVAELIRHLVTASVPLYQIIRKRESLEDIFLSITKEV